MIAMEGYPAPIMNNGSATVGGTSVSINKVRLDTVMGSGANGFVFSGEDLWLKRPVAVKVWPPRLDRPDRDKDRTDQALAEAQKIANLKSEYIASIYSVDRLPNSGWIYAVMEYIEGEPLADVRTSLNDASGFIMRTMFWGDVYRGLDTAERIGIYHGDVHKRNVIVRPFHATLVDFGTSILNGKDFSIRRHAEKVHKFAKWLMPELKDYIQPLDVPNLVRPEYATCAAGKWVEASLGLRSLEPLLSDISEQDLARQLTSLAGRCSSILIDLHGPVTKWLESRRISPQYLQAYTSAANAAVARLKEIPYPRRIGLPLRPVPPYKVN